jgi:molybdenum cofactor guanylyltransferase
MCADLVAMGTDHAEMILAHVSKPVQQRIGGIVLCGGQSRRMGRAKAWLSIGQETFLRRIVRTISSVVRPVVVVAAADQDLPPLAENPLIGRDEQPGRGPLQGLLAGLEQLGESVDAVYLSSCDVPLLRPAFIQRMITLLDRFDIAVPEINGPHPLSGVYRVAVHDAVRALLQQDRLRLVDLFSRCSTRFVTADELRDADPDLASLRNVNTPEEYAALLRDAACPRASPP